MRTDSMECPVCHQLSRPVMVIEGHPLLECSQCGLRFFDGRTVPADLYAKAYEGKVEDAHMQEYQFRAQHLFSPQTDAAAPPVFRLSLRWLVEHAQPAARVLDVGCGRGIMLRLLRSANFDGIGLDLSPKVAALLAAQNFRVHVGPVESYPGSWPEPAYVTCNYVLHHVSDPVLFLRRIRERFPRAILLLAQGLGYSWIHSLGLLPISPPEYPRDLTTWNTRALSLAFARAGYTNHKLLFTKPSPREVALPLQRKLMVLAAPAESGHAKAARKVDVSRLAHASTVARFAKTLFYGAPALYARTRRLPPAAVLVVASPPDLPAC